MKKIISVVLSLIMLIATLTGVSVFATDEDVSVELDGKIIEFDVNPQVVDGRTLVPLRKIFEEIGALVKWDNDTQTVSARKSSKTISLTVGSNELNIDKGKTDDEGNPIIETITLEVPAQVLSGRTLVPARAISESFGLNVDWDEKNQKVIISSDEEDDSWKEKLGFVNLDDMSFEGEGIEISGNQIKITQGGDYEIKGTLEDGNIVISTKEKVKLRLEGVKITSGQNPCIFVEDADKAYITISKGTENYLVAQNSEDGAIYSKENLEIKGGGKLDIKSLAGHGIKASDNLSIENGTISIEATSDGIHVNDTFKMIGGDLNIVADGDGIDSESIVNISGGNVDIETNATPIETPQEEQVTQEFPRRMMWEEAADVEFEKSSKGINAEWMMCISGGNIAINSASHGIHCQDELQIDGGKFTISSKYDKGISAHGNLTISGKETNINITKSTEGIESKNVMTINDGIINVVSTDDAINATGGNSGMMMPGGNFGGNGEGRNPAQPEGFTAPPEGFENMFPNPENQTSDGAQPAQRPGRGPNGGFGGKRPARENAGTKEGAQPAPDGKQQGGFMPPFVGGENGEMAPPDVNWQDRESGSTPGNRNADRFVPPEGRPPEGRPPEGRAPEGNGGAFQGGMMGGFGRDMKECLIINGGYLELSGADDCVDTNGNMVINGGTIKANNPTGSFTGNFGVLDADGKIVISENANIILASGSGNERSLSLTQNAIIVYCENQHEAKEVISVSDANGNVVYEYAPEGSFKSALIASNGIKTGEKYSIKIGNETFEAEVTSQNTIVGTQSYGGMGFGRGQNR